MKNKTILLVEDNADDVTLALRAFRKNNIANDVVIATDGQEALDYIFGTGAHEGKALDALALILLDLKLPRIDGFEVLRRLNADERTRLTPVVVLTSSKEEQDLVEGYRLGANSYIRKPVDFKQFMEVVNQLGMYWLVLNEPPPKQ